MKVTVCFGNTRILVPVGEGNITVHQLIQKSITRYRKIAKKDPNEKISVHNVHSEAGILDPDDTLADVVSDKEVLFAEFEEETPYSPVPPAEIRQILAAGVGESGGSEQSSGVKPHNDSSYFSMSNDRDKMAWVDRWVANGDQSPSSPSTGGAEGNNNKQEQEPSPRGSHQSSERSDKQERAIGGNERAIGGNEREIGGNERAIGGNERAIGGNEREIGSPPEETKVNQKGNLTDSSLVSESPKSIKVDITRDNRPLGCNVQYVNGRSPGLYIMSIEPESAAALDGQLMLGDRISEVNGVDLSAMPLVSVLDIYEEMVSTAQVRMTVHRQSINANNQPTEVSLDDVQARTTNLSDTFEITLNKGQSGLGFTIATRDYTACKGFSPLFVKTVHRHGAAAADGRMKPNDILLKVNGRSVVGMSQSEVVAIIRELTGTVTLLLSRSGSDLPPSDTPPVVLAPPTPTPAPVPAPVQATSSRTKLTLDVPLTAPDGRPIGFGISVKGKSMSIKGEPRRDYGIFIKTILEGGAAHIDGRLRPDDQLLVADGQKLKGRTNKEALLVLKQALDKAATSPSLPLVVSRKDHLNLSSDRRTAKPYSSFKDNNQVSTNSSSLAADPGRYRAMSLSSPNLGRKKKHNHGHVDFNDGGRGVAFSENIQSIPQAGDVLESDEDVVFVCNLGDELNDPFNREDIFRKSMKKIDHQPINPNSLRRASSHDSLARPNKEEIPLIIKKGVSQESVFSAGNTPVDPDGPVYDTITDETLKERTSKLNDSILKAMNNGKIPPNVPITTTDEKSKDNKSKNFLNFFSKKGNKKKDDKEFQPHHTSSPVGALLRPEPTTRDLEPELATPTRGNVRGPDRDQPRAAPPSDHQRSRSSDYYRDKDHANQSGVGYIEHRLPPRDKSYISRVPTDRHSNRSNNSGRSRGDPRATPPGYNQYRDSRNQHPLNRPVRDSSRETPTRERDHPVRESSRDTTRDSSRDITRDSSRDIARDSSRDAVYSRDRRYMETVQFRYGRSSPSHHSPPPPPNYQQDPYYPDQRYHHGSNQNINKRADHQRHLFHPPPQLQGRHNPEQLSDI